MSTRLMFSNGLGIAHQLDRDFEVLNLLFLELRVLFKIMRQGLEVGKMDI